MGCCLGPARGARIPWICQPGALDPLWVAGSRMTRFRGKVALHTGPGAPLRPAREPPRGGGGGGPPQACACWLEEAGRGQKGLEEVRRGPEEASLPRGGGGSQEVPAKTPGFRVYLLYHSVGGARGAGMHGASRLASPRLRVRVFSPLAKLGPLRAPRGGCRALSEDFRV